MRAALSLPTSLDEGVLLFDGSCKFTGAIEAGGRKDLAADVAALNASLAVRGRPCTPKQHAQTVWCTRKPLGALKEGVRARGCACVRACPMYVCACVRACDGVCPTCVCARVYVRVGWRVWRSERTVHEAQEKEGPQMKSGGIRHCRSGVPPANTRCHVLVKGVVLVAQWWIRQDTCMGSQL